MSITRDLRKLWRPLHTEVGSDGRCPSPEAEGSHFQHLMDGSDVVLADDPADLGDAAASFEGTG
jgi:hypothetical protein